jgi:hypothetical protein
MISDDGLIIASKELLELLGSSQENIKLDKLKITDLILGIKKFKCALKSIKIEEFTVEIVAELEQNDCIEILNTSMGSSFSIPNILTNLGNAIVTSIELTHNSIIKICAARTNS